LIARLYTLDRTYVSKYNLRLLPALDQLIADTCEIGIPFSNYITGASAFIHKAGIHAKAVLADPGTYEILRPEDFGLNREIAIGHRLTGWNAIRDRAETLGLSLPDDTIREVTRTIKQRADTIKQRADDAPLSLAAIDDLLREAAGAVQEQPV